jgi:hypothetical protein
MSKVVNALPQGATVEPVECDHLDFFQFLRLVGLQEYVLMLSCFHWILPKLESSPHKVSSELVDFMVFILVLVLQLLVHFPQVGYQT